MVVPVAVMPDLAAVQVRAVVNQIQCEPVLAILALTVCNASALRLAQAAMVIVATAMAVIADAVDAPVKMLGVVSFTTIFIFLGL
jgi:hypothetical protein